MLVATGVFIYLEGTSNSAQRLFLVPVLRREVSDNQGTLHGTRDSNFSATELMSLFFGK